MKVLFVRNWKRYGHLHRDDCLSKGTSCIVWAGGQEFQADSFTGLARQKDLELLADRAYAAGVVPCSRCLPDLYWETRRIRRIREAADSLRISS